MSINISSCVIKQLKNNESSNLIWLRGGRKYLTINSTPGVIECGLSRTSMRPSCRRHEEGKVGPLQIDTSYRERYIFAL